MNKVQKTMVSEHQAVYQVNSQMTQVEVNVQPKDLWNEKAVSKVIFILLVVSA